MYEDVAEALRQLGFISEAEWLHGLGRANPSASRAPSNTSTANAPPATDDQLRRPLSDHAPPPGEGVRVMHMRRAPAATYLMAVTREGLSERSPIFKIGWAFRPRRRADLFNRASLPALGGLQYTIVEQRFWGTASEAFRMERQLLIVLQAHRHPDNREVITGVSEKEMIRTWCKIRDNMARDLLARAQSGRSP